MIIVKLMGGLGNQMFQYAAGRRIALRHNTGLKFDLSFLKNPPRGDIKREYELHHLNVKGEISEGEEVRELKGRAISPLTRLGNRVRSRMGLAAHNPNIMRESHFHYDERFHEAPDNVYLEGYFQSERYFADIADNVADELSVKSPLEGKNLNMAREIERVKGVSVHIRRADFVHEGKTHRFHGVLSLDYYKKCVRALEKSVKEPHFFLFSDDWEWVRENFHTPHSTTLVDINSPGYGHEDMRLMSLCTHHIVANSSFSWWGAWLNRKEGKRVYAPKKWFAVNHMDTRDLCPRDWELM